MRPGFGRKRFSSSVFMNAPHAVKAVNRPIFGWSAGQNPEKPRLCAMSRHAKPKSMVPCAATQNSVQTRACSEIGPTGCRFPLSCPPPFLPFLPLLPGMQPGDTQPDCTPESDRTSVEAPCSWLISIARTGHEYAAVLRLLIDGIAQRTGCADVARRLIGRRRIAAG